MELLNLKQKKKTAVKVDFCILFTDMQQFMEVDIKLNKHLETDLFFRFHLLLVF